MSDLLQHQETAPVAKTEAALGGWLTLLTAYLRVVYPILAALTYFQLYGLVRAYNLWMGYVWIELIGLVTMSALAFITGSRLRNRMVKASRTFAIYAVMVVGPIWQLVDSVILPASVLGDQAQIGVGIVRVGISLAFASGWAAYLLRSKKVAAIYR
jgi:hypothetical protein